jgi:hypothetical protein
MLLSLHWEENLKQKCFFLCQRVLMLSCRRDKVCSENTRILYYICFSCLMWQFLTCFYFFIFYFPLFQPPASHKNIRMEPVLELIEFTGAQFMWHSSSAYVHLMAWSAQSSDLFPVTSHSCCTKHIVVQKTWISHYFFPMLESGKI